MFRDRFESPLLRGAVFLVLLAASAGGGWIARGGGAREAVNTPGETPSFVVEQTQDVEVQPGSIQAPRVVIDLYTPASTCAEAIERLETVFLQHASESATPLRELTRLDADDAAARNLCSYNTYWEFISVYAPSYFDLRIFGEPSYVSSLENFNLILSGEGGSPDPYSPPEPPPPTTVPAVPPNATNQVPGGETR